ncbi:MAG: hypothetical protein RI902_833 [Pseudomonadota bacterium]
MADDDTPAGFLSRWSRRKADVREGRVVVEEVRTPVASPPTTPSNAANKAQHDQASQPVPTMEDVQQLNADSNFASFMSSKVAPEVKNAAMKKLFADPHFNVMDGLDIYIDDYGIPDPLPAGMLEQMTRVDGLNLFNDKNKGDTPADQPEGQTSADVAQSSPSDNLSTTQRDIPAHDHADLRLQPNPAARPEGAEPKPE